MIFMYITHKEEVNGSGGVICWWSEMFFLRDPPTVTHQSLTQSSGVRTGWCGRRLLCGADRCGGGGGGGTGTQSRASNSHQHSMLGLNMIQAPFPGRHDWDLNNDHSDSQENALQELPISGDPCWDLKILIQTGGSKKERKICTSLFWETLEIFFFWDNPGP